jgi:hypothetical protein
MRKRVIRVRDPTSYGGRVLVSYAPPFTEDGMAVTLWAPPVPG